MKKCISYWAFPGGLEGTKDVEECFREAKEAGFEAVELACGDVGVLTPGTTEKECAAFRAQAEAEGVEISSLCSGVYWGYNLGCNDEAERNRCEQAVRRMLRIGEWLGVDALLYIPAAVDVFFNPEAEVIPYDVVWQRATEGTKKLVADAEKHKVALCVENVWNKFLMSPTEMCSFVDQFDSEYVGAYLDVGNVMAFGYPEQWIRILGPRIRRVHFKDFKLAVGDLNGFCDLLEGDVNWPEVMQAFEDIGYDGYVTAEMIPLYAHHPMARIENTSNAMDAILGRK